MKSLPEDIYSSYVDTWIQNGSRCRCWNGCERSRIEILSVLKLLAFHEIRGCYPLNFRYEVEAKIGMMKIFYGIG